MNNDVDPTAGAAQAGGRSTKKTGASVHKEIFILIKDEPM